MRVLIDLQACQNGSRDRGIGRSSLALSKAIVQNAAGHEIIVLLNGLFSDSLDGLRDQLRLVLDDARILIFSAPGPVDALRLENTWRRRAAELLREQMICRIDPDAVLVMSTVEGAQDDTVSSVGWLGGRAVQAALLHDLIPLLKPDVYLNSDGSRRWYMEKVGSLRRCDLLLAVSEYSAAEAVSALGIDPSRVVSISSAADRMFAEAKLEPDDLANCLASVGIDRPYLMHAGVVEARKNFSGLIRAFALLDSSLREQYQLVLAGKFSVDSRADLDALARASGLRPQDVVMTGHVTDHELMALYAGCHLFVYPSLHEGFGLPALEAMHFGAAVIGSNVSSIPEVIGREDALFDPTSTAEMASLITRCLRDDAFRAELQRHSLQRASSFSWDRSARRALAALEMAVKHREQSRAPASSSAARLACLLKQIAVPPDMPAPDESELVLVAQSIAENDLSVQRLDALADRGARLRWRLEGPFDSSYSLALVNRESARALEAFGHEVELHSSEGPGDFDASPRFLAAHPDLSAMHRRAAANSTGRSDVVSRNMYPPRVAGMLGGVNLLHQYAWEETGLPLDWAEGFNRELDGITCTSTHVRKVLIDNGVSIPIAVVGNGVDHWERIEPTRGIGFPGKRFCFIHVSSCFPRKGIDVLLRAFGEAFTIDDDVSLLIKTFGNPLSQVHVQVEAYRTADARFPDVHVLEGDLSDADLKAMYLRCQVLVAPSRAEGFGLPLAEAMLSGLPVITTAWGGQLDFCCEENAWLVDYSFDSARTQFNLTGSAWAEPDQAGLARALRSAYAASDEERRRRAAHGRAVLLGHYRWADVTARAVEAIRAWQNSGEVTVGPPRVGWITTWNTRCGIAAYARNLAEAASAPFAVLAPHEDSLLAKDESFVRRCWRSGKHDNGFDELSAAVRELALDVLVIQFNYAFFEFEPLSNFLQLQADEGRVVIVTVHATADPPAPASNDTNWSLRSTLPGLARCDRVLAHCLADLNRLRLLGLTDNVTLFPHPLLSLPVDGEPTAMRAGGDFLIATFGFCLPHKGLVEVVNAVAQLRRQGLGVRLLMLNAEFSSESSRHLAEQLRGEIARLGLEGEVDLRTEFLSDHEIAKLLHQADLIVYAYQNTQESASGAVRQGMAAGRPLLVTPHPIFDELGSSVFRAAGSTSAALATAIRSALAEIADSTPEAASVAEHASRWRAGHDLDRSARRLMGMARGLLRLRQQDSTAEGFFFDGSSRQLRGEVALSDHRSRAGNGKAGTFCAGPLAALAGGTHEAILQWSGPLEGRFRCEVLHHGGQRSVADLWLSPGGLDAVCRVPFTLSRPAGDVEIRLTVADGFLGKLESLTLRPALHHGTG